MNSYCQELHDAYQMATDVIETSYPLCNIELLRQIDTYSRACALYLWSSFGIGCSECVEAINVIYSKSVGPVKYTDENVRAAMNKLSSKNHSMPVPRFFLDFIAFDKQYGTNISRRLSSCFQTLNILYAMIDNMVKKEEVDVVVGLQKTLIDECDKNNILEFKDDVDPYEYVSLMEADKLFVTADRNGNKSSAYREDSTDKRKDLYEIMNRRCFLL